MKFGIALTTAATPVYREAEQRDFLVEALKISESKGYESVWVSDRTLYPNDISQRYPQQFGPGKSNPDSQNILESLTTLSFIAGKTQSIHLGTSVLVLPFRNPLLNTKMISTLDVLSESKRINPNVLTKTSIILGLGETDAEIEQTMDDLIEKKVDILTIGQYLRPTRNHYPIERWVTPEEFDKYRKIGLQKGFLEVVSGPMVRSSYRAERALEKNNAGLG